LKKILMDAVVNGVVPLHVPAVVVLVYAVTVDPHDRGMFFGAIEIFGDKKPAGDLLAVWARKVDELRLDKLGAVHSGRHGVGEAHGRRAGFRSDRVKIGAVARVGMLINEAAVAIGPVRLDICAWFRRNISDLGVHGIIADFCNAQDAIAGSVLEVGVESDARAVVRPSGTPSFKFSLCDLDGVAARRGHDVEMVPAVLIA
jgi:hypothetical protein